MGLPAVLPPPLRRTGRAGPRESDLQLTDISCRSPARKSLCYVYAQDFVPFLLKKIRVTRGDKLTLLKYCFLRASFAVLLLLTQRWWEGGKWDFLVFPGDGETPASFSLPGRGQAAGPGTCSPWPPQQAPSPEVFSHTSPFSLGLRELILS